MSFNRQYALLLALLVAGCGGGGYDGVGRGINPPSAGATNTAFTPFIKSQIAQNSDTAEPIDVNDRQFQFDEDEMAFDDVLQ